MSEEKKVEKKGSITTQQKKIGLLRQSCRRPYYGYINVSIDRVLNYCMVPNLSRIDDKKCEEELHIQTKHDGKEWSRSLQKSVRSNYFAVRNIESSEDNVYHLINTGQTLTRALGISALTIFVDEGDELLLTWACEENDSYVEYTTVVPTTSPKEEYTLQEPMLKLGLCIWKKMRKARIVYIPISYSKVGSTSSHSCLIVMRLVGNKIDRYLYDPRRKILHCVEILAQYLVVSTAAVEGKKLEYKYTPSLSVSVGVGPQSYTKMYKCGYCQAYTLLHVSLMSMSMPDPTSPNFTLGQIGDCINYSLVTRFTPCQIALLVMRFYMMINRWKVRPKNLMLERFTEIKKNESIQQSEQEMKVLDNFYDKLELETQKQNPDYTQLIHYAFNTLGFTKGDWETAIDAVKERLLGKKIKIG